LQTVKLAISILNRKEMPILVIREQATAKELIAMAEALGYIKSAVDIRRGILAGGGLLHADCEAALLEDGSRQEDVWGADWFPESQDVSCLSLINIRPQLGNTGMEIQNAGIRGQVEAVVKRLLGTP
jgi:hypothetical protein